MVNDIQEMLQAEFRDDIKDNISIITDILEQSVDLVRRDFQFQNQSIQGICFYTVGLADRQEVESVIEMLQYRMGNLSVYQGAENLSKSELKELLKSYATVMPTKHVENAIDAIVTGDSVFFIDGLDEAFILPSKNWEARSVDEPSTEQVVRGPRDGFTETIRVNTALVRRRIRSPLFRIEGMVVGTKTKTEINLAYLKGTVKEGLVEEIKKRLEKIKIDGILESGYIEELIDDAPLSPFPTIQNTERPDKVAAAILEGRVAIFIDNTPFVLIAPTYFWQLLQASDDYYSKYYTGTFFRLIRYIAFVISLTLPSIYVMLASFHQEMIPTPLALTIASGREIVPYPVLLEAIIMEVAFELMREAGIRMPKPIGQAVSIVGSLIIGQAAVQAGLVSPFMVIVVALTGIASFSIPNFAASFSIRLVRFPLLIASGTLGLLGFAAAFTMLAIHTLSLRSFGEPYSAPATPFQPSDQKDILIRYPWWNMERQPKLAEGGEDREAKQQMPKPPQAGEKGDDGHSNSNSNSGSKSKDPKKQKRTKTIKPKKLLGGSKTK